MGLRSYIKVVQPDWKILEAANGKEAISIADEHSIDVIVLDYQLPQMDGLEVTRYILRRKKHLPILLYTFLDSLVVAKHFLRIGGRGFVTKGAEMELFMKGIESLLKGDYFFHSGYEVELIRDLMDGLREKLPKIKFSERELQIGIKLSKGFTAKTTAEKLNLSVRTVEIYRASLLKKTQTKNAAELVGFIYEHGIKVLGTPGAKE